MDVSTIKKWQTDMKSAVEDYFGPNSRTSLSVGDNLGFARLHLTTPIEDEDEFLSRLPPNKRSIVTSYHDKTSMSLVYEFTPIVETVQCQKKAKEEPQPETHTESEQRHSGMGLKYVFVAVLGIILSALYVTYSQTILLKV